MILKSRVSALALVACISPGVLWAQNCIAPGSVVTINAAGIDLDFSDGPPGLVLAHSLGRTRARVLGQDGDQLTFQVPLTGLPHGAEVAIYAINPTATVRLLPGAESVGRDGPSAAEASSEPPTAPAPV